MKENSARKIADKICQFVNLKSKYVLEIGCGDGRITSLLAGKAEKLIAIEPDENKISKARKQIAGVECQVGSGENLEFSRGCFDLLLFTLSLHHQNSRIAIREAVSVLNDEGEILVIEPLIDGELERVCH